MCLWSVISQALLYLSKPHSLPCLVSSWQWTHPGWLHFGQLCSSLWVSSLSATQAGLLLVAVSGFQEGVEMNTVFSDKTLLSRTVLASKKWPRVKGQTDSPWAREKGRDRDRVIKIKHCICLQYHLGYHSSGIIHLALKCFFICIYYYYGVYVYLYVCGHLPVRAYIWRPEDNSVQSVLLSLCR